MEQSDLTTLSEMQKELRTHSTNDIGRVAERLLRLRDTLKFDDTEWYHDLTQKLATLDSASTFHPSNAEEKRQVDTTVQQAVREIGHLLRKKE